jgi:hypothetical protein
MAHEVLRLSKQKSRTRKQGAAWRSKAVRFPTLALSRSGSEGCPFGLSACLGTLFVNRSTLNARARTPTINDSRITCNETQAPLARAILHRGFSPCQLGISAYYRSNRPEDSFDCRKGLSYNCDSIVMAMNERGAQGR